MFGDRDDDAWVASFACDSVAVYFGPVSAVKVFDEPIALFEGKSAVLA